MTWKVVPEASEIRRVYRLGVAVIVRDGIRLRVSQTGQGETGTLSGYSTNPVVATVSELGKPKKVPPRGWGSFYKGGYKQYREEVGLVSDIFVFSNKGNAWRDWKFFPLVDSGDIEFGFSSGANSTAADQAIDRGRPDMFGADEALLDEAAQKLLDTLLDKIYG